MGCTSSSMRVLSEDEHSRRAVSRREPCPLTAARRSDASFDSREPSEFVAFSSLLAKLLLSAVQGHGHVSRCLDVCSLVVVGAPVILVESLVSAASSCVDNESTPFVSRVLKSRLSSSMARLICAVSASTRTVNPATSAPILLSRQGSSTPTSDFRAQCSLSSLPATCFPKKIYNNNHTHTYQSANLPPLCLLLVVATYRALPRR